jgi:chromosome segregation ATPase
MSADVRSIAALQHWRAQLATYAAVLAEAMAGVDLEIRRVQDWLEEQLRLWKRAIRQCEEEVTQAKAELAQRQFPTWDGRQPDCTVQERNLRRAKARLEYAEEKVETIRRWIARLPKMIDEVFTGPSRRLRSMLEADLPNALAELGRRLAALESYAGLRPDHAPLARTAPLIGRRDTLPPTSRTDTADRDCGASPSPVPAPAETPQPEENA